ncbi:MAG: hypothetical protein OXB93_04505 [Cytophagales bacterium]|nr:hypothetical protein [Cytophagales bacterium]
MDPNIANSFASLVLLSQKMNVVWGVVMLLLIAFFALLIHIEIRIRKIEKDHKDGDQQARTLADGADANKDSKKKL